MIERHPVTDRASWLAMRSKDLTASDFAAAIGDSPYKTALELYAEKTGHLMPQPETPVMRRGRLLEPTIVAMFREEHPDRLVDYPLDIYLRDPEARLGATPDAVATIGDAFVNLQLKAVNRHVYDRDWAEGPPKHYIYQTAIEGMLLNADYSLIVALVVDYAAFTLVEHRVERNAGAEANFRAHAAAFWDNVATGKRPPADLKRDAETLAALYPVSVKEPVADLSAENELPERLSDIVRLKAEVATRTALIKEHEVFVKDKMGPAEVAELPGWKITWKTTTIGEHIRKAVTFRALKITEVKQQDDKKEAAE